MNTGPCRLCCNRGSADVRQRGEARKGKMTQMVEHRWSDSFVGPRHRPALLSPLISSLVPQRNDRHQLHQYTNKACIVPDKTLIFTNRMITVKKWRNKSVRTQVEHEESNYAYSMDEVDTGKTLRWVWKQIYVARHVWLLPWIFMRLVIELRGNVQISSRSSLLSPPNACVHGESCQRETCFRHKMSVFLRNNR